MNVKSLWLASLVLLAGCGGTGTLTLTTWGEEFIEQGLPASEFEDGYQVQFAKFLVVVNEFTLATKTGTKGPSQAKPYVADLTKPGPIELERFDGLAALKYDAVSFAIAPAADAEGKGGVAAADVEALKSAGASLWVVGTVSKGATSKSFDWKFDTSTAYENCSNPDFGEGITVPTGGSETAQLTIHGDHLFYDDLQSQEAKLRGEALVGADANGDGAVTRAELAGVQLTTLPLGQYGTGGASSVKTLDDFVRSLTRSLGHFRGEGECDATAR